MKPVDDMEVEVESAKETGIDSEGGEVGTHAVRRVSNTRSVKILRVIFFLLSPSIEKRCSEVVKKCLRFRE